MNFGGIRLFTTEVEAHDYLPKRGLYLLLMLGTIQNRERFLHSGAVKLLPNEENAPETQLSAADPKYYAVTWRFEEITPVLKPAR